MSEKIPISELIVRGDAVITNSSSLPVCDQRGEYSKKTVELNTASEQKRKKNTEEKKNNSNGYPNGIARR